MPSGSAHLFASSTRGLQAADYLVVLVYILAVMGVGIYISKQQKGGEDYFVASRKMPWVAVGLSLIATLLSSISYLAIRLKACYQETTKSI